MLYKEDWEETQEEFKAFWKLENKKPLVAVTAPRREPVGTIEPLPVPAEIAKLNTDCWYAWALDPDFAVNRAEINFNNTFYGGAAFPFQMVSFGPDMIAAYLGVEPTFEKNTTWFRNPVIKDWDNLPSFQYDPENKWWKITKRLAEKLAEKGKDRFVVAMTDIAGGPDTLVSLRGATNLLLDFVDHREEVKALIAHIHLLWIQWYEELYHIIQKGQSGIGSWLGLWSPGKHSVLQCDFAHMVSPEMFEEMVIPYLKKQCDYLDETIYHLDGKGQLVHLDSLLNLPGLNGIQWSVPVSGVDPPYDSLHWLPYFRRIQDAGKILQIINVEPRNVNSLVNSLCHQGLFLNADLFTGPTFDSEKEAKQFLKEVVK